MNTKYPGIFIPFMTSPGDVSILRADEAIPNGCTKLFNALSAAGISNCFYTAVRFSGRREQPVEYGVILHPEHPHQMEYQSARQVINQTFDLKDDELTIPIKNVPSPGLGIITKSVYIKINSGPCDVLQFNTMAAHLRALLRQPFLYDYRLILSCIPEGFEIHGTSPISAEANGDAWQQHLGKALRKLDYTPVFSQTWSTNKTISDNLMKKSRERQKREELEYIAKIQARKTSPRSK